MADRGTLEKLTIDAYDKPDYSGDKVDSFAAYVNPAEIALSYEYEYDAAQGAGTTGSRMEFKKAKPGDLTLTFFLDGTGANKRPADVQQMVQKFQDVTGYDGKIHRPRYLIVMWGKLQVKRCVLKSATITYKLFEPSGIPLRATIAAAFADNADDTTRVALAQDQSADLTHVRLVKAGDTLPALCHDIYGDPRRYLAVAAANGLDQFRELKPGTRIFFPPVAR